MFLVSCRKDLISDTELAKKLVFCHVPGGDFRSAAPLSLKQWQSAIAGKRLLVLVHGFRTSAVNVLAAYHRAQESLKNNGLGSAHPEGYDLAVGFLWPGGALAVSFAFDVIRATQSARCFHKLLQALGGAASVDVQTHSLGARVALQALSMPDAASIRHLLLLGPAVDNECIQTGEVFAPAARRCRTLSVCYSRSDLVLRFAYRLGDFPEFDLALGAWGPQNRRRLARNIHLVDCSKEVLDHGSYGQANSTLAHWALLLRDGLRETKAA